MYSKLVLCICVAVGVASPDGYGSQGSFGSASSISNSGSVGGYGSQGSFGSASSISNSGPVVPILVDDRQGPDASGAYSFNFETGNGISRQETGIPQGPSGAVAQSGGWSYTLPDGTPAVFKFVADENGYRVESNLLPTPPPLPPHAIAQIERARQEDAAAAASGNRGSYASPSAPSSQFSALRPSASSSRPSTQYGAPSAPAPQFARPSAPAPQYSAPRPSASSNRPSTLYGAPSAPAPQFASPSAPRPSRRPATPSSKYGAPQ